MENVSRDTCTSMKKKESKFCFLSLGIRKSAIMVGVKVNRMGCNRQGLVGSQISVGETSYLRIFSFLMPLLPSLFSYVSFFLDIRASVFVTDNRRDFYHCISVKMKCIKTNTNFG